jgi:hypothetical protein
MATSDKIICWEKQSVCLTGTGVKLWRLADTRIYSARQINSMSLLSRPAK